MSCLLFVAEGFDGMSVFFICIDKVDIYLINYLYLFLPCKDINVPHMNAGLAISILPTIVVSFSTKANEWKRMVSCTVKPILYGHRFFSTENGRKRQVTLPWNKQI